MAPMNYRTVHIKVIEANNLEDVRPGSKMKVYAKISIDDGYHKTVTRTPVDKECETNPRWISPVKRDVEAKALTSGRVTLQIKLYCTRTCCKKDLYIGEVYVPDLYARSNPELEGSGSESRERDSQKSEGEITESVTRGSQKSQGEIKFSWAFDDVNTIKKWKKSLCRALETARQVVSSVISCFGLVYNSSCSY